MELTFVGLMLLNPQYETFFLNILSFFFFFVDFCNFVPEKKITNKEK